MSGWPVPERIVYQRVLLRRFRPDDLVPFVRFMTTPEVTRPLAFDDAQKTPEGGRALLEQSMASYDGSDPMFVLVIATPADTAFLGACGLSPTRETGVAECFWALLPEAWGRGLATESARVLLDHAFGRLGIRRMTAVIAPSNVASRRVAERIGMKDGGRIDDGDRRIFVVDAP